MNVTIYHNTAKDDYGRMVGLDGYQAGHTLEEVFSFEPDLDLKKRSGLSGTLPLCELAFTIGNIPVEMASGKIQDLAQAYRENRIRSVSVGDVVCVRDGDDRLYYSCEPTGWTKIKDPFTQPV